MYPSLFRCPNKDGPFHLDTCDQPHLVSHHQHPARSCGQWGIQTNRRSMALSRPLCPLLAIFKYVQWLPLFFITAVALKMCYHCLLCNLFIPWTSLASKEWHLSTLLIEWLMSKSCNGFSPRQNQLFKGCTFIFAVKKPDVTRVNLQVRVRGWGGCGEAE